jgi:hypothetical protein
MTRTQAQDSESESRADLESKAWNRAGLRISQPHLGRLWLCWPGTRIGAAAPDWQLEMMI